MEFRTATVCSTLAMILALAFPSTIIAQPSYIYAPAQRNVVPKSLYMTNGTVNGASNLGQVTTFHGINASITLDFGINIGGTVYFEVESVSGEDPYLGFTFTESSQWISPYVCDSGTSSLRDSPLWFSINGTGPFAAPKERQRGGFRYMSVWHNSTGSVRISNIGVDVTVDPTATDLRTYTGSFDSENDKLNRVWYAGAWTNQLCLIDPIYGNALDVSGADWYYNSTIASKTESSQSTEQNPLLTVSQMDPQSLLTERSVTGWSGQVIFLSLGHQYSSQQIVWTAFGTGLIPSWYCRMQKVSCHELEHLLRHPGISFSALLIITTL